jgi:hypothetical protein
MGIESSHGSLVVKGVDSGVSSVEGSLLSESSLDFLRVDDSEDVSVGQLRSRKRVSLLVGRSRSLSSPDLIEGFEGILGPDDESSDVTSRGQSEEVQSSDGAEFDSGNVSEGLGHGRGLSVDNQGSDSSSPSAVSGLSLSSSNTSAILDLLAIFVSLEILEDGNGSLGLGDRVNKRVVDNEGNLGNLRDSMSSGHHESGDGRSSNG